jgi:hypothetical protein
MPFAELDRIALVVDDLDAVTSALKSAFDIDLTMVDAKPLGIKAAIGHSGIELVQQISDDCHAKQYWNGPLAAICIRVEDLEEAGRRMEAAGYSLVQTAKTPGGMLEYFYGSNFHGIPIVLHESSGDLLNDAIGDAGDAGALEVNWKD